MTDRERSKQGFIFYTADEYRLLLAERIAACKSGDRVLLTTMGFHPDEPQIDAILQASYNAAAHGAAVTLLVDAHTFLVKNTAFEPPGPLWYNKDLPQKLRQPYEYRFRALRELTQFPSGSYAIINPPGKRFPLSIAGRSHIKLAIINDEIFLGGCNLQGTGLIDLMTGWQDTQTADWLYETFQKVSVERQVAKALDYKDLQADIGENASLLIDAGTRDQSLILDSALTLIDQARKSVLITCQFFPNSATAAALVRAHKRGVKVEIIFSHPSMHGPIAGTGHRMNMLRERLRVPTHFFKGMIAKKSRMLHAKLLVTDAGSMIGSHNYVRAGVALGTAEIALLSRDPNFGEAAKAALGRARAE